MKMIRRAILAAVLMTGIAPAFAQAPAPVPALPDTERRTSYSISGTTCACAVGFQLYGDGTDYANWVEVFINGAPIPAASNWTITSPSGPLVNLARPITDAVLTFLSVQTGTVQIIGARRPRRTSQVTENRGVAARDFNQAITDLVAMLRENWDKTNDVTGRAVMARPGETLALLPVLASRQNMGACFDSGGNLTSCVSVPSSTFAAGAGITFTGTNPTTISANVPALAAGLGIALSGSNPIKISASNPAIFNVTDPAYGAKCDGVTHDEVAFQNALNAAIAASGVVQLPIGNCVLNANITNGTSSFISTAIRGYGNNSTITFLGSFGFSFNATASYYFLQNFQIVCQSASTNPCVKIFSATQSTSDGSIIEGVLISSCGNYGWYFQNMAQAKFINNTIVNTGTSATAGLYMDNSQTPDTGGNLIRGNYITTAGGSTSVGIYMVNNGGVVVDNNHVGNAGGYATDVFWIGQSPSTGSSGITITGNMLDNCLQSCIQLNSATQTLFHLVIASNLIHVGVASGTGILLNSASSAAQWLFNVAISGNTIDTPASGVTGINVFSTGGLTVTGNSVISTGGTSSSGAVTLQSSNGGVTRCTATGNAAYNYSVTITNTASCVVAGNTS